MYIPRILAAISAASLFTSTNASVIQKRSMTAAEIVGNIQTVTTLSLNLQGPAQSITVLDGAIIAGFTQIISIVTEDIEEMQDPPPALDLSDEQAILNAFRQFVVVHQKLLNILIGKAGLLNIIPLVGTPVAAVLRGIESVVDTIAFALIDLCPNIENDFVTQKGSLDITISLAINTYAPL